MSSSDEVKLFETATRLYVDCRWETYQSLDERFRFRPPDYWRSPAYAVWKRAKEAGIAPRGWDGYVRLLKSAPERGSWWMDRGHKEDLLEFCRGEGYAVDESGLLESPFSGMTLDDIPDDLLPGSKHPLDDRQRECIVRLLRAGMGTVKAAVNSGKSMALWGCAAMLKRQRPKDRILYVTPAERLVKQAVASGREFLPDWEIGQYGGGKKQPGAADAIVATVASLVANMDELSDQGFFKSFSMLLYDECHHSTSVSSRKIVEIVPAFFRIGMSDTVKDERKEDTAKGTGIRGMFGPCRFEIDMATLVRTGRSAMLSVYVVEIPGWRGMYDDLPHIAVKGSPAWAHVEGKWQKGTYIGPTPQFGEDGEVMIDRKGREITEMGSHEVTIGDRPVTVGSRLVLLHRAYDKAVVRFRERNDLIVAWAKHFSGLGRPTLIVATRTVHVHVLESLLATAGVPVRSLISDHTPRERDEAFAWLSDGIGNVLVSPLMKEGVSMPELRGGIVADTVTSVDLARQIAGRFMRKKTGGDNVAHLVWFNDTQMRSTRYGCKKVVAQLKATRAMRFCHPCAGPTSLGEWTEAADFT